MTQGEKQAIWDSCLKTCSDEWKQVGEAAHMYRRKVGCFPKGLKRLPVGKAQWNMIATEFYRKFIESNKARKARKNQERLAKKV